MEKPATLKRDCIKMFLGQLAAKRKKVSAKPELLLELNEVEVELLKLAQQWEPQEKEAA